MNIEFKKNDLLTFLTTLALLFSVSCKKEQSIEIKDFREKYYGDFRFEVIYESWMLGEPITYDTFFYNGVSRKYELIDSDNYLYVAYDDVEENSNEKITIEFKQNAKITSLIIENGILTPKSGYHYHHYGEFIHIDTIEFYVGGLGGLGGGLNYEVIRIRVQQPMPINIGHWAESVDLEIAEIEQRKPIYDFEFQSERVYLIAKNIKKYE